jgi:hypothetical protein
MTIKITTLEELKSYYRKRFGDFTMNGRDEREKDTRFRKGYVLEIDEQGVGTWKEPIKP